MSGVKWVLLPEIGGMPEWHAVTVRPTPGEPGRLACGAVYAYDDVLNETRSGRFSAPKEPEAKCHDCVTATDMTTGFGGRSTMAGQ